MASGSAWRKHDFPRDKNRRGQRGKPWEPRLVESAALQPVPGGTWGGDAAVSAVALPLLSVLFPPPAPLSCSHPTQPCRAVGLLAEWVLVGRAKIPLGSFVTGLGGWRELWSLVS